MSLSRAAILAPVIVVSFGALAGLIVLWTRVALDPILRRRRGQDSRTFDTNPGHRHRPRRLRRGAGPHPFSADGPSPRPDCDRGRENRRSTRRSEGWSTIVSESARDVIVRSN